MCCGTLSKTSRLGVFFGFLSLVTLLTAFVSGSWIYTKEPVRLPNSEVITTISFRIGLWRVCPSVKKVNSTAIHVPSPACVLVKYSGWKDIHASDLGVLWAQLEMAPTFITKMRSCTVLTASALILVLSAFFLVILGQCNNDNKTLVACGLFLLGGLSLGTGLIVFASVLSETLLEATQFQSRVSSSAGYNYDYRYGWCYVTAGAAFIMTKIAALFSLTGYLKKFPSVDEMVRVMVPGADRKLKEHQKLSCDYVMTHTYSPNRAIYASTGHKQSKHDCEYGPLLHKTPPDVCSTNKLLELTPTSSSKSSTGKREDVEHCKPSNSNHFYGQTVPIQIKNYSNLNTCNAYPHLNSNKYSTLPHGGTLVHEGFLGVSEMGSSSSNSSSSFSVRSKTLQIPRQKRRTIKFEGFQCPEGSFVDFSKRTTTFSYSGSAV